ncbi:histidine phosphatase family protein [Shigella flexneri]
MRTSDVDRLYSGHRHTPNRTRYGASANLHTLLHDVSFDLFLCSELERAQHTARLVLSDRQLPVHIIPELNEMFLVTGRCDIIATSCKEDAENYSAWCNDWQHAIPTKGGSSGIFTTCGTLMARLSEYQHYQNILIVSHQGVLSLLIVV